LPLNWLETFKIGGIWHAIWQKTGLQNHSPDKLDKCVHESIFSKKNAENTF
jgi:hypothetical protein